MKKMCYEVDIQDEKSKRKILNSLAAIEGVESVAVDMKEGKITVIGDMDPLFGRVKLREVATFAELFSVGPAEPEKFKAKKAEKKEGSNWDTENRGANHYLGVQKEGSNWDTKNREIIYVDAPGAEAVGGCGGMNPAIEDNEGSKTRTVEETVAGFGDFSSIQVDIKKGIVTVVGKSVPVRVALKVREMGYRAKLLSLGPATEQEDPDEEDNEDLSPNYPSTTRDERYPAGIVTGERYPYFVGMDEDYTISCTIA